MSISHAVGGAHMGRAAQGSRRRGRRPRSCRWARPSSTGRIWAAAWIRVLADRLCAAVAARTQRADAAGAALWLFARATAGAGRARFPVQPTTLIDAGQGDRRRRLLLGRAPAVHRQHPCHQCGAAALRAGNAARRARRPDGGAVQFGASSARACAQFHFADAEDWHANDAETSLMLALAPEMVRPESVS